MLFTRKGDKGTTKIFACDQRISKSSAIAVALGTLDEINSHLGVLKVEAKEQDINVGELPMHEIIHSLQKDLFIVQAEIAGADKHIQKEKVLWLEEHVNKIESELPPIKTFFISGGTRLASLSDVCRTVARRAERTVIAVVDEGKTSVGEDTLAYLNRLSSMLYALARYANFKLGVNEESPDYM